MKKFNTKDGMAVEILKKIKVEKVYTEILKKEYMLEENFLGMIFTKW